MKDLYKTLATDAYLNAVEVIRAEKKKVARMACRALNESKLDLCFLSNIIGDNVISAIAYYYSDNQYGISVNTDEYKHEMTDDEIYKYAWSLCDF